MVDVGKSSCQSFSLLFWVKTVSVKDVVEVHELKIIVPPLYSDHVQDNTSVTESSCPSHSAQFEVFFTFKHNVYNVVTVIVVVVIQTTAPTYRNVAAKLWGGLFSKDCFLTFLSSCCSDCKHKEILYITLTSMRKEKKKIQLTILT